MENTNTQRKLSDIVREIPQSFEYCSGDLYKKGQNGKKCQVCALGGIALLTAPDRFRVDEAFDQLADYISGSSLPIGYDRILKAAGVPENKIRASTDYEWRYTDKYGNKEHIRDSDLDWMIYRINDSSGGFEEVAKFLEAYGL